MNFKSIPTGRLPYEVVDELPTVGEEYKVYGLKSSESEEEMTYSIKDYCFYDGEYHEVDLGVNTFSFITEKIVSDMQAVIEEQAQKITELEEAVFGKQTTFQMTVTSLVRTSLNLINENGEVVIPNSLQTERWSFEDITYQVTVPKGTYYLRSEDNYAIGVSGEILPLVVDGTDVVDLGTVKVILLGGK